MRRIVTPRNSLEQQTLVNQKEFCRCAADRPRASVLFPRIRVSAQPQASKTDLQFLDKGGALGGQSVRHKGP
jgi:hypothetical protein